MSTAKHDDEGYVPSSQLNDEQNAQLRAGKMPGELTLEVIQTVVAILAFLAAMIALVVAVDALSTANANADLIEQVVELQGGTIEDGDD